MSAAIDNNDVAHWKARVNDVLARPAEHLQSTAPADAQPWTTTFCGCLSPLDLCLVTWCLPCVTFGKTHHRLHKDATLQGYEPVNTSCLLFCGAACCGLHWIPAAMQRAALRARYNLTGSCVQDLVEACCCPLCALTQEEKEARLRGGAAAGSTGPVQEEYKPAAGMTYPGAAAAAAAPAATPTTAPAPTAAP